MIKKMYDGIANSPETYLTQGIDANVTDIVVDDAEMLLQGENLAVIGLGIDAETIKYSSINGNILVGCTRGFQGVAKSWESGIPIARNFTAYDHNTFKENVENLDNEKADKTELNTKVDKVSGKQLSTNDYTTAEKNKLTGIQAGAQVNAVTSVNGQTGAVTTPNTTYDVATTSANGLMSSADKTKLNGVEAGAQKNSVTSVQGRTGAVTVSKSDVGLGNVDNIKQMPISGGILENYREKLTTVTASGGSINLSLGNVFQHTPSGNITYTITNAVTGQAHSFTLIINMGSTVRTLTFPASVKWQGGEIPDLSGASKTYILTFVTVNGGSTWFGMFGGKF